MQQQVVIVVSRSVIRFFMIFKPGLDDCMIIGALLFTIAYQATIYIIKVHGGMGMPIMTLSSGEMTTFLKGTFAIEIFYYTIVFCVKSSIIFMYQRFAIWATFKRLCIATNVLLVTFYIACIAATLGQCAPLEKAWDVTRMLPGKCINTTAFFYFTSGFNIITDFWILLLPIPTLRSLKISRHSRYVLYGIFGIGSFATAMSCVRLYSIHIYTLAEDPFKDGVLVNLWSMVEVNIAIICASIPALKPLVAPRKLLNERRQRRGYSSHITEPLSHRPSKTSRFSSTTSRTHIATMGSPNRVSSPRSFVAGEETSGLSLPLQTL
ncbi:hypothetical protein E0Z10_g4153 [Xylaria hypoxylon]|uniref:Rhodopsin domain-containing protein n=1 Tax=Xylaria hypoxylon TaxID=37992 RepID=A0A4Z0Z4W9_9PEZI|nr:hypothetical protein E0Z10_g4153 [Xylaria hypoxylon]